PRRGREHGDPRQDRGQGPEAGQADLRFGPGASGGAPPGRGAARPGPRGAGASRRCGNAARGARRLRGSAKILGMASIVTDLPGEGVNPATYELLKGIDDPAKLRALDRSQLRQLADELRAYV